MGSECRTVLHYDNRCPCPRVYDLEEMTSAKHNFQVMSISSCLHFQQGDNESLSNAEGI